MGVEVPGDGSAEDDFLIDDTISGDGSEDDNMGIDTPVADEDYVVNPDMDIDSGFNPDNLDGVIDNGPADILIPGDGSEDDNMGIDTPVVDEDYAVNPDMDIDSGFNPDNLDGVIDNGPADIEIPDYDDGFLIDDIENVDPGFTLDEEISVDDPNIDEGFNPDNLDGVIDNGPADIEIPGDILDDPNIDEGFNPDDLDGVIDNGPADIEIPDYDDGFLIG